MVVMGWWLDLKILEVFFNISDSMILSFLKRKLFKSREQLQMTKKVEGRHSVYVSKMESAEFLTGF